jgi:3'(2'), 5'-bisphosphate nucleotidase
MKNWHDVRVNFALKAVQGAACLASDIQNEMVSEAITKDDRSPVTVADFAAQAVVGYMLESALPGALLVGEEQADILRSPAERETLERITNFVKRIIPGVSPEEVCDYIDRGVDNPGKKYWTLDPIDGTKGFLRGAQYACALAYVEDGVVKLGVLGCPNITPDLKQEIDGEGSILIAVRGEGSWIVYLRLLSPDWMDYREKIWDQAAGSIIVEEAGGKVTDLDGKTLDFSQGRTLKENRGICASNGLLHKEALEALRTVKA